MNAETKPAPVLTQLLGVNTTGNLSIVTPGPIDEVAEPLLAMIDRAVELFRQGSTMRASAMILEVERRLKVSEEDRAAAASAKEDWEVALEEALAGMSAEDQAEVDSFSLPEEIGRYTPAEVKELTTQLANLKKARNAGNRQMAHDAIKRIRAKPGQRIENRWRTESIKESVDLRRRRGESVVVTARGGAEIKDDGLQNMRDGGYITQAQYDIGMRFREGWEARSADMGAQTVGEGGSGHDNNHFVAARFERAKKTEFVARTIRQVALGCISHPNAMELLKRVVGDGHSLRFHGAGRALERNRKALVQALDIAAGVASDMAREAKESAAAWPPAATS